MRKVLHAAAMMLFLGPAVGGQSFPFPSGFTRRPELVSSVVISRTSGLTSAPTVTIPAETEATVQVLSGIHTQVSHVDDPIKARLLRPVLVNGQVALPAGTLFDGRVTRIRAAGRLHRSAELALRFEQITLPDGQVEPIAAALSALDNPRRTNTRLDSEGYLRGGRSVSWKSVAGGLAALGAFATVKATIASASAAAFWPALPLGGTALLGYEMLWRRGSDVHLPPQTPCRIRLDYPLTVRVPW